MILCLVELRLEKRFPDRRNEKVDSKFSFPQPLSMNLERAVFDQPTAGFASNSPGFSDYYANKENLASSPGPSLPPTPGFAVPATPPRRVGEFYLEIAWWCHWGGVKDYMPLFSGTGGPLSPSRSIDSQMAQRARNQQTDGFASPSKSSTRWDEWES